MAQQTMNQQVIRNESMKALSKRQDNTNTSSISEQCTTDTMERQSRLPQHQSLDETSPSTTHNSYVMNGRSSMVNSESRKRTLMKTGAMELLSHGESILRDNTDESNSTAADAFSNSLVDSAFKAAASNNNQSSSGSGGEEDSSSSGRSGGGTVTRPAAAHHATSVRNRNSCSNNNSSRTSGGSSDDAGTGTGESGHVVTATGASTTQTGTATSSGDDRDSSRDHASVGGTISVGDDDAGVLSSETSAAALSPAQPDPTATAATRSGGHHRHRHHNHHHALLAAHNITIAAAAATHSSELLRRANDGSTLQLPRDDGSDRLSTVGGPATVVASRMSPPNADKTNSSSGSGGEGDTHDGLLQRHHEPGYHTIRKTFSRLPKRNIGASSTRQGTETSSSEEQTMKMHIKGKHGYPMNNGSGGAEDVAEPKKKIKRSKSKCPSTNEERGRGSPSPEGSSGSGTEGGYMGSADSKENDESSSSPSMSSSEGMGRKKSKRYRGVPKDSGQFGSASMKAAEDQGNESSDSSSSEIADFSSGTTSENGEDGEARGFTFSHSRSSSPSISSRSSEDGYEATYLQAKTKVLESQRHALGPPIRRRKAVVGQSRVIHPSPWPRLSMGTRKDTIAPLKQHHQQDHCQPQPHIMTIGSDIMAHVLTFLQPPDILDVLTMPLSRDWRQTFTFQPELWRVLCLVEPFKAEINDGDDQDDMDDSASSDSFCSLGKEVQQPASHLPDKYRLLYTSFVRCMKYLSQIREDALNGRAPSFIDYRVAGTKNQQILVGQDFLARARGASKDDAQSDISSAESSSSEEPQQVVAGVASMPTEEATKKRKRSKSKEKKEKKPKLGYSMITNRLLGPSASGEPGSLDLSWSCAIYSIVNWMVSFSDVEGIQTLCLKVLPFILENEQQRQTAQRAGLTDIVLREMVLFPDSVQLHIAALHTIVLLARPLGGREGMLFHSSMVLTGIFGGQHTAHPKSGIAVVVEAMQRFEDNDILQAMSCWALVNIALAPSQKAELVKLGGIKATCNAMLRHPFSAEVQFRALFALINLVIPSVRLNRDNAEIAAGVEQIREVTDSSEREIIDEAVSEIASLVVQAMKNFCSSEAILNRACLVLHNLSLTHEYHSTLLWTPNCYQMLEWCLTNYRTDQVLQQSATGTLRRLQMTLSSDSALRVKFTEQLQSQQQATLYQAHREALRLHQRQEELNQVEADPEAS